MNDDQQPQPEAQANSADAIAARVGAMQARLGVQDPRIRASVAMIIAVAPAMREAARRERQSESFRPDLQDSECPNFVAKRERERV